MGKGILPPFPGLRGEESEADSGKGWVRDWKRRPDWLRFLVSDEMNGMTLLMPHAFQCLWLSLRRKRPNKEVQNDGDSRSCPHGGG